MQYKNIEILFLLIFIQNLFTAEYPIEIKSKMAIIPLSVRKVSDVKLNNIVTARTILKKDEYVVEVCLYDAEPDFPQYFQELRFPKFLPVYWFLNLERNSDQIKYNDKYESLEGSVFRFTNNGFRYLITLNQKDHPEYGYYGKFETALKDSLFTEMCFK